MRGERVTVIRRVESGRDRFNDPIVDDLEETVDDVLVAPGELADNIDSVRPDGTYATYTLMFPKTYAGQLESCDIMVRGNRYGVIGHPDRFAEDNCPTRWNMTVRVGATHG